MRFTYDMLDYTMLCLMIGDDDDDNDGVDDDDDSDVDSIDHITTLIDRFD